MKQYILLLLTLVFFTSTAQEADFTNLGVEVDEEVLLSSSTTNQSVVADESTAEAAALNSKVAKKLLKVANESFEKMWYADASQRFEEAFSRIGEVPPLQDLQKAADSYYYIGDMKSASKWYQILYDNYEEVMSQDDLFKYSDALKGINNKEKADHIVDLFSTRDTEAKSTAPSFLKYKQRIVLENLKINTAYSEFGSTIKPDGKMVFASSADTGMFKTNKYKWNNQPFLDLYEAKTAEGGFELSEVEKYSKLINTKHHEASATFSPDGNTIYFTRNSDKRKKKGKAKVNHLKIYTAQFSDGKWSKAQEISINNENYSTGHPALTPDGKHLYFVSDMPGGYGNTDIYVVEVNENGTFSEPKNLGPEVNSKRKEMFPYSDGSKLYFSSDRKSGLGGLDIYESVIENTVAQAPKNLGTPFNSIRDDFSYVLKKDGKSGYLASNRKGGKGADDIYYFERGEAEGYIENKNQVEGTVVDAVTLAPLGEADITLFDANNIKIAEVQTDNNGSYTLENLIANHDYSVKVNKVDYQELLESVRTKGDQKVFLDQKLSPVTSVDVVTNSKSEPIFKTEAVYFNFDSFSIREDAKEELDRLADYLVDNQNIKLKIESHTDSRGAAAYNKYLSGKRANASKDYLLSRGVSAEQIVSAIGYGEEQLLNECQDGSSCTRKAHQLNRRSEFIFVQE